MSSECRICERDTRGPHATDCPHYSPPLLCECGGRVGEEWECEACGQDCWAAPPAPSTFPGGVVP